jgi:hypothetical protein
VIEVGKMNVYILQHVHEFESGDEDVKLIGVYSSSEKANEAIARLREQRGFKEFPSGFHVDRYLLDEDHWREGFVTVPP